MWELKWQIGRHKYVLRWQKGETKDAINHINNLLYDDVITEEDAVALAAEIMRYDNVHILKG